MTRRVTKEDLRPLGYCHNAARKWFADRGLDWADFIENGIEIEELERVGDHLSARVIERVKKGADRG